MHALTQKQTVRNCEYMLSLHHATTVVESVFHGTTLMCIYIYMVSVHIITNTVTTMAYSEFSCAICGNTCTVLSINS